MKTITLAAIAVAAILPLSLQAQHEGARLQHMPQALTIFRDGKFLAALPQGLPGERPALKATAGTVRLISEYHAFGNSGSYRNSDSTHYVYSGNRTGYFDRPIMYDSALRFRWDTASASWKQQ